jgi:hypothetical protein
MNYGVREFDLSSTRDNKRIRTSAEHISVLKAEDTATLRLDTVNSAPIPVRFLESLTFPDRVSQLYLSNPSGSGKLTLLFGVDDVNSSVTSPEISGTVDVSDRAAREIGKARLQDSGGVLIDPAKELPSIITDTTTATGSGSAAELQLGNRRSAFDVAYSLTGSATVTVEVSSDGATWRTHTVKDDDTDGTLTEDTAFEYVRAYADANLNAIELSAKGV